MLVPYFDLFLFADGNRSPHHWAVIPGASMDVAAGVGTAAVTMTRTRRFMNMVKQ